MRIHNPFKHQNRSHSQKQSTALSRSLFPKNLTPDIQLGSKYASEIVKKKKKKKKQKIINYYIFFPVNLEKALKKGKNGFAHYLNWDNCFIGSVF